MATAQTIACLVKCSRNMSQNLLRCFVPAFAGAYRSERGNRKSERFKTYLLLACVFGVLMLCPAVLVASVGGSISGTVRDERGGAIPGAEIHAEEVATKLHYLAHSNDLGRYAFPVLPPGSYELTVKASGFAQYRRVGVVLDINSELTIDTPLQIGSVSETVSVRDEALHAETTGTQLGEVIQGKQIAAIPLNGRSYTDLLSLQPGVAPGTSITTANVDDLGAQILNPSGTLNPGTISVNGQREFANFFTVNGSDVEEDVNAGAAIVPNLDAIAEFRIVTSNFDAQYGEFSGGQISVVTKSGTNSFHGSAFEFLRNTALDAKNYFSQTRGVFRQNQFGGTFGGPLKRDRAFFFADYQGTRQTQGVDTGDESVPSLADRQGDLSDVAGSLTGSVHGPYLARLLAGKLGYAVQDGEPYYAPDCSGPSECVFPQAIVPQTAWSVPAQRLIGYIPAPNNARGKFSTSAFDQTVHDDKEAIRADAKTRLGLLSAYYFLDDYALNDPYPVAQSGASVPGFSALNTGRAQMLMLGATTTIGDHTVNELRGSFLRDKNDLGQPVGGRGVSLVSQGFANADGSPSIVALDPRGESVENVDFNGFSIGAAANELLQTNNIYQVSEDFSRVIGAHTFKAGGEFHSDQVNDAPVAQFNGNFIFSGNESGNDFADFLVGVPSQYNQSQLDPFYARNQYLGLYAQDSWHVRSNLTLNYGMRWDRIAPWTEKHNEISTFVPGEQSVVFPGAPVGIVYPGDPGIPSTLAKVQESAFAPRFGMAWSPAAHNDSFLSKIIGGPGSSSVRASFGEFYTAIDALTIGVLAANAPYGTTYTSPSRPLFATPFDAAATGVSGGQPFPYTFAPLNSSPQHPDMAIDWSTYEPISGIPAYDRRNRTPYTEEWMLSLERQAGPNAVLDVTYVGNSSRRQRVLTEANPGDAALCLSLSKLEAVQPGTITCRPNGEDSTYYPASGGVVQGTRGPLGPAFGSNALQSTIGIANYNALQFSARYSTTRLELSAAYTFSKSLDLASNVTEDVNPFNHRLGYAISSFDVRHNGSISYSYQLPVDALFGRNRASAGWSLSGITRFASGFPVTLVNNGDNSLIGSNPNGVNNSSEDEPDYNGGSLHLNHNPRTPGNKYFSTAAFRMNALGTPGTAKRRFFYGPGMGNFDMALAKLFSFQETKTLQLRLEGFNVFNHAQFSGPSSVDGNIGSTTFGNVVGAASPRLLQAAIKLSF